MKCSDDMALRTGAIALPAVLVALLFVLCSVDGHSQADPESLYDIVCGDSNAGWQSAASIQAQRVISESQNPVDGCDHDASRIVVQWPDKSAHRHVRLVGLGGQLAHLTLALGYAVASGAVFTVAKSSSQYAPTVDCSAKSLQCYFKPLSTCSGKNLRSLRDWSLQYDRGRFPYEFGLPNKSTLRFIFDTLSRKFNTTSAFEIERELVRYVLRPNAQMCARIRTYREGSPSLVDHEDGASESTALDFVAMHFRLGDKSGSKVDILEKMALAYTYHWQKVFRKASKKGGLRPVKHPRSFAGRIKAAVLASNQMKMDMAESVLWSSDTKDTDLKFVDIVDNYSLARVPQVCGHWCLLWIRWHVRVAACIHCSVLFAQVATIGFNFTLSKLAAIDRGIITRRRQCLQSLQVV